jgi:hypothetical protein
MKMLNIEISPTHTYAHAIYDTGTFYLFAIFYFIGHMSQLVTCYFLNKSMKVFSKEWLIEEESKKRLQKKNPKVKELVDKLHKDPSPVPSEVLNLAKKYVNSPFRYPILLDSNTLELIWHIERCKEQLRRVSMSIDFNSFNKKYYLVRNLDLLSDNLGGEISMETIIRVVYFDLEQSNKLRSRQDFSFTKKEMKYAKMPDLSKFTKNNIYIDNKQRSFSFQSNFLLIQNLELVPKKILMNNLEKNVAIAKQSKWNFKNNLLSDNFILKSLGITHVKKLVGSSVSNDVLKQNI